MCSEYHLGIAESHYWKGLGPEIRCQKQVRSNELAALVLDNPSSGVYNEIARITPVQGFNAYRFTARSSTTILKFQNNTGSNPAFTFYVDNITVKEINKSRTLGTKRYELNNHLSNVLATISDRKMPVGSGTTTNYYMPEILSSTDYYAFGQPMPGRQLRAEQYRYGFNGKENDADINGQ